MADPVSIASGILASLASVLHSSEVLSQTISNIRINDRVVLEIREELQVLIKVLTALQVMASNTDLDHALLQTSLLGYSNACEDFKSLTFKITPHSDDSRTSIRDWAKLRYMGEDIIGFKKSLARYKSTFTLVLADANLRASAISGKALEEHMDTISNSTINLEKSLQEVDKKLKALSQQDPTLSDNMVLDRQQIQEERDSIQKFLDISTRVDTHIHNTRSHTFDNISAAEGAHLTVTTTTGDLMSIKNVIVGDRSVSLIGEKSDATTLAQLVSLNAKDDASIRELSDQSSSSSITSSVASGFSIISGSSKSSVLGPAGAGERLVSFLLSDNHLSSLYQEALKQVTADKFEVKFRRLLKAFAIELRKEAKDPEQRDIARFVRCRARNSAHLVRNSICSPNTPQKATTTTSTVLHEPLNMESDDSDEDSGPDHEDNTNFQRLEHFIITSQALVQLRQKLSSFLYSVGNERTDDKGRGKSVRKLDDNRTPVNERSFRRHLTRFATYCQGLWEPRVPEGKTRVRWKCKCGQNLYDDYIELQPGAAKRLEELLNERPGGGDNSPTRRRSTHLASERSLIPNIFMKWLRTFFIEEHSLPQHLPPTANVQHHATTQAPPGEASFLLICHNVSNYDKKLLQLSVCDVKSDESFFRALKIHFQSKRTKWLSFISLRALTGIKFVKFELYRKSQSVDICLQDDIPPPDNSDYRYTPVPLDVVPPIGESRLMHLLNHPDEAEDVLACLERFPKKLREKLACGDKAITSGWGLHLEEGVCKRRTAIVYMLCVLVSSIFGILWTVLRHDIQGAFSVSAYMIGITMPLVTLMQHLA